MLLIVQIEIEGALVELELSLFVVLYFEFLVKPLVPFKVLLNCFSTRTQICSVDDHFEQGLLVFVIIVFINDTVLII